jgi:hypothetical protein
MEVTNKRGRRSQKEIEEVIKVAAKELIEEVGFTNLTLTGIIKKAELEPSVFYKRYSDLDDLLDKFVRDYDYWLNDSINFDADKNTPLKNCENLLIELVDSLNSNVIMQKLLAWEILDSSYITKRTAENRERHSVHLLEYFNKKFDDIDINFDVVTALLISGIYYIILHKKVSTFCSIDFTQKENIDLLKQNIKKIVAKIYAAPSSVNAEKLEIAKRLFANKVDYKIIQESTGLSDEVLKSIMPERKKVRMS